MVYTMQLAVSEVALRHIGGPGVGIFPLRVTLQPFFKHTVNSSVVEDEEWVIWRRGYIQDTSI